MLAASPERSLIELGGGESQTIPGEIWEAPSFTKKPATYIIFLRKGYAVYYLTSHT
jgi:hypothetical protein